ncbi:hypothetical protein AB0O14_10000 [Microbacterium foliorum]
MTETVWVAIIAVAGTALGAAVSPIVDLVSKAFTARTDDKSTRIRAAADFSVALRELAHKTSKDWDPSQVRTAYDAAIAQRFEVAKTIPKGAGRVDWFCEYAVDHVHAFGDLMYRTTAADYASSQLLGWARGDRKPAALHEFALERDGSGGLIVV